VNGAPEFRKGQRLALGDLRGQMRRLRCLMLLVAVMAAGGAGAGAFGISWAQRAGDDLCRNQHSMIELQRLFLQEHEAIRHDLHDAGRGRPDYDQGLLDRIERLIKASDCTVASDETG